MAENGCSEDPPYSARRICPPSDFLGHVFAKDPAQEGRQDARLLERRREPSRRGGRVVQRHVLYWGRSIHRRLRCGAKPSRCSTTTRDIREHFRCSPRIAARASRPIRQSSNFALSDMQLCRPRQWGACWLAGQLWRELELDRFWADRLPPSRKGTQWDQVLQVLVSYRLIAPGSEWKLHRDWFGKSAMADLLGTDFGLAEAHKLYACHDLLLQHKADLFSHLMARWCDLFNANFDVLLYDLTSTYFEINASDVAEGDKRRHGYSRDKRPDCPQVVIALVVTPDGLPLAYEVLPGDTADCTTLRMFLARIERQYGRARRVWVMDRGIPTEAVLAEMRGSDPPVQYLVGTPKGRLSRLEKQLLATPWQQAREGVQVELLAEDNELYVFAESVDRASKEARDAQSPTEVAVEAAAGVGRDGSPARGDADEAGCGTVPRSHRMAPGRYRDGQGKFHVRLHPQPPEAVAGPAAGRTLSAAHQIRSRTIPRCCGDTIPSSLRWKKRSKI